MEEADDDDDDLELNILMAWACFLDIDDDVTVVEAPAVVAVAVSSRVKVLMVVLKLVLLLLLACCCCCRLLLLLLLECPNASHDLATLRILPTPAAAAAMAPLVDVFKRLVAEESSNVDDVRLLYRLFHVLRRRFLKGLYVPGKGGKMRPHSVPPKTLCDEKVSSSHFMSAMERRTTTTCSPDADGR
jgi:hypothetical protein